jgi:metallophosphoesterase (TIGR03767 family)
VEFVDPTGKPVDAAWRPQEALQPQVDNAMVRQINAFTAASPTANGNGTRRRMDLVLGTGDLIDNQQLNETRWVGTILEGGRFNPGSGVDPTWEDNAVRFTLRRPSLPVLRTPLLGTTAVQEYDDYVEGPDPQFYDPDQPTGQWSDWPSYTGMMDAAQRPFTADGLNVPSYVAFGNHDALVQGNQAANQSFEQVATGCIKPLTGSGGTSIADALANLSPATLQALAPNDRMLVPPDPNRQFVSKKQYKSVFQSGGQADGHGFDFVDPAQNTASGGAAGYYSWSPVPRVRFIALDTTCDGGIAGPSADGNIDDPQFRWLKGKLQRAQADGRLVVLFSHHAIQRLTCNVPDEAAPPCTGPDSHGHDANPGCDVDPRSSKPIHLGADVTALLHQYPNAVAWVAGHSHVNDVTPSGRQRRWLRMIRTAAEADWPQQSRLVELFDNHDGTPIFGTILDHASNATAPTAISNLANPDPFELASIGRTSATTTPGGRRACSPNPCGEALRRTATSSCWSRTPSPPEPCSCFRASPSRSLK